MYVAPLESYGSGLFSASITSPFGMIIDIKDSLILKDLTQIVYSSGSHGFLSPKICKKCINESDTAGALKLWYRGGMGSIGFSRLQRSSWGRELCLPKTGLTAVLKVKWQGIVVY